ncbi:factor of DNA methylation 5-like [Magnolia sinica]|uniref:factor of DNA methylation 5-like n=1 Tax=Magnolia sinica TaxID=86752 RepID=UPI00265B70F0|nr:factor of DNA methylation 5-like [Magnolia sinica]
METSSEEDGDISESEIRDYEAKSYLQLKTRKHKVKLSDSIFRCPFCKGKKKQDFIYKDLLQHATGVGLSNRKGKVKANHRALMRFLKTDVPDAAGPSKRTVEKECPTRPDQDDPFVWPWMGIIYNLPIELEAEEHVGTCASTLKMLFSKYNPVEIHAFWDDQCRSGNAIVEFQKDWSGFKDAMAFEKSFEVNHFGKRDWNKQKHCGSNVYGWVAQADDYNSMGPIGEHLRANGALKTVSDLSKEEMRKNEKHLTNLATEIDIKNKYLKEMECRYNETSLSLSKVVEEKNKLLLAYTEEMREMQRIARDRSSRIFEENKRLKSELESQGKELERRRKELEMREAQNDNEKRELDDERKKNEMKNSSLQMANLEKAKADEKVLKLLEDQKTEKEALLNRILRLEKELDAKHQLELDIQQLKGKVQVLKHMGSDSSLEEMTEKLKEKEGEMEAMEDMNQTLIVRERSSNDELQDARKVLIKELNEMCGGRSLVGIKRMGEINLKPFRVACMQRFSAKEAEEKSAELCSFWQDQISDPAWHPYRIVRGESREEIDDEDEKLKQLKDELGDGVYEAVTTALLEMNEYNPSGRYVVQEIWNFKAEKKAEMKEVMQFILKKLSSVKRKK